MPVAAPINIFIDVVNNVAYASVTGNSFVLPQLYYGSVMTFNVYPMIPVSARLGYAPSFQLIPATGMSLEMAIGPLDGTFDPVARQDVWTVDPTTQSFMTAALNLNTTNIATLLAATAAQGSEFNITLVDTDASKRVILQTGCTLNQVVENPGGGGSVPVNVAQYLTAAQCYQLFLRIINQPGVTVQFSSPDGTKTRIIGIDNSGNPID